MSDSTRKIVLYNRKTLDEFTTDSVKSKIADLMHMSLPDLMDLMQNRETSCLDLALGSILLKTIKEADTIGLNFLFNRSIGKIKEIKQIEKPIDIEYITEVNADGNLIQEAVEINITDERDNKES